MSIPFAFETDADRKLAAQALRELARMNTTCGERQPYLSAAFARESERAIRIAEAMEAAS